MAADLGARPLKVEAATAAGGGGAEEGGRRAEQVACVGVVKKARKERVCTAKERISRMTPCAAGKRSSIYRGVTRHRWTGRYEAHLWDKSTWNQNQNKKGKQGAYDDEEAAARAYDLAALKYWGAGTLINFPVTDYTRDLEEMQLVSKEDYLVTLRRKSSAFSRGIPKCRGASSQRLPYSRWDASCSQMAGSDYFNNFNCSTSRDAAAEGNYSSDFGMERKIDLTGYIRWWAPKKSRQSETASSAEDVGRELQELEGSLQASEPYKLPYLGIPQKGKVQAPGLSACSILSRSADYKNFLERSSEIQDGAYSKEKDHGKGGHQLFSGGFHKSEVTLGMAEFPVQRAPYTLAPHMSAPVRTSWNPVDHIPDPVFWASLVAPTEQPVLTTHKKNEISSPYIYQCQQ